MCVHKSALVCAFVHVRLLVFTRLASPADISPALCNSFSGESSHLGQYCTCCGHSSCVHHFAWCVSYCVLLLVSTRENIHTCTRAYVHTYIRTPRDSGSGGSGGSGGYESGLNDTNKLTTQRCKQSYTKSQVTVRFIYFIRWRSKYLHDSHLIARLILSHARLTRHGYHFGHLSACG